MKYVLLLETLAITFYVCKLLNAFASFFTKSKRKLNIEKKEKIKESEDERKLRIILENIENYGSERSQQEI